MAQPIDALDRSPYLETEKGGLCPLRWPCRRTAIQPDFAHRRGAKAREREMKRTGWIGILLLAWILVAAGAAEPLATYAGELPENSGNDPVYCSHGTVDGKAPAGVDGDPDDVIGGNKNQSGATGIGGSGEDIAPEIRLIEAFLRHVIVIIWLQY